MRIFRCKSKTVISLGIVLCLFLGSFSVVNASEQQDEISEIVQSLETDIVRLVEDAHEGNESDMDSCTQSSFAASITTAAASAQGEPGTSLRIIAQPQNAFVPKAGKSAELFVAAEGEGLKYTWYSKKPGSNKFAKVSGGNKASVKIKVSKSRTEAKCEITDKNGNKVISDTVSLLIKNNAKPEAFVSAVYKLLLTGNQTEAKKVGVSNEYISNIKKVNKEFKKLGKNMYDSSDEKWKKYTTKGKFISFGNAYCAKMKRIPYSVSVVSGDNETVTVCLSSKTINLNEIAEKAALKTVFDLLKSKKKDEKTIYNNVLKNLTSELKNYKFPSADSSILVTLKNVGDGWIFENGWEAISAMFALTVNTTSFNEVIN